MKPADAMVFQKRNEIIEGDNESIERFETDILAEGDLKKLLMVTKKTHILNNPGRQYMRLFIMTALNNLIKKPKRIPN